jgi:hypothetical protein
MSKNLKSQLSLEDRINAEFKHLRKRIKKLEDIILKQTTDAGNISDMVKDIKKG